MGNRTGYEKAKADMRALTEDMRVLRYALGAKITWNTNWSIRCITIGKNRIAANLFQDYSSMYLADCILLDAEVT